VGEIVTPVGVGILADRIGIPAAVGVTAIGPVVGALIVLRYAPETRGKTLEEISADLDRAGLDRGRSAARSASSMPASHR